MSATKVLSPTDQQRERVANLKALFHRVQARINLKKFVSLGDAMKYLGVSSPRPELFLVKDHAKITEGFKVESAQLLADEETKLAELEQDNSAPPWESYYQTDDWKIESEPAEPPTFAVKRKHLTRREQLYENLADILPPDNPKQKCKTFPFQEEAALEMFNKIVKLKYRGVLLWANTGDGKTFANGRLLRWLLDIGYHDRDDVKWFGAWPYLYVTKASIVEQTTRDLRDLFGIDTKNEVRVINYDSLRASLGEDFVKTESYVEDGIEKTRYVWRRIHPLGIILDEYQAVKNDGSIQSEIIDAFNELKHPSTFLIASSATPFAKVASAKRFCVATRIPFDFGIQREYPLDNEHWPAFTRRITDDPRQFCKASMKRLLKVMHPYIVGFKNVRRKFKGINNVRSISFESEEKAQAYAEAWTKYLEMRAKLEAGDIANSEFLILVEFLKFRQAAELIKVDTVAEVMYQIVQRGKAAVYAGNFKPPIGKLVHILTTKYGVSRSEISLIWGGDDSFGKSDKLYTSEEIRKILTDAIRNEGNISKKVLTAITKQLNAQAAGLTDLPPELELGTQSRQKRQEEIDKFQDGRSKYCLFTFGAGGAGLSLHQHKPELRPRESIIAPTYNEMELHQALGRAPRLTSCSDTYQTILLYRNTIEEKVLYRVARKSDVLKVVIDHAENEEATDRHVEGVMKLTDRSYDEDEEEDIKGEKLFGELMDEERDEDESE